MQWTAIGVHALIIAQALPLRTGTDPVDTTLAAHARVPAGAAVRHVDGQVRAHLVAQRLTGWASANAAHARLTFDSTE